jgi:hypothetical protein
MIAVLREEKNAEELLYIYDGDLGPSWQTSQRCRGSAECNESQRNTIYYPK